MRLWVEGWNCKGGIGLVLFGIAFYAALQGFNKMDK